MMAANLLVAHSSENVPLAIIRRFARGAMAYLLLAYYCSDCLDIIKAYAWVKKHRSHRGNSTAVDAALESLYLSFGRDASSASTQDQ